MRSVSRHGGVFCFGLAGVLVLLVSAQRPLRGSDRPVSHASQNTRSGAASTGETVPLGLIRPASGSRYGSWYGPSQSSNLPQEISVSHERPQPGESLPLPLRRQGDYYSPRQADSSPPSRSYQPASTGRSMANGIVELSVPQYVPEWQSDSSRHTAPTWRNPEIPAWREAAPYREAAAYREASGYREAASPRVPDYRDPPFNPALQQPEMSARSEISTRLPPPDYRRENQYSAAENRSAVGAWSPEWAASQDRQEPVRTARAADRPDYPPADPVPSYASRQEEHDLPPALDPVGEGPQFDSQPDSLKSVIYGTPNAEPCEVCEVCIPEQPYEYQILPEGLMYRSYIAGPKEPRMASNWLNQEGRGMIWEATLGGRVGLIRNGTRGAIAPEGWQLDLEGAAQARVDWEDNSDLDAADFRAGLLFTWRRNRFAFKAGYYHVSSHLGDEYMLKHPDFVRRNYVRDSVVAGMFFHMTESLGLYNEVGYALGAQGGAEPLEYQTGIQYAPMMCVGPKGAPFAGFNAHFRQEFGMDAGFNAVAGWGWVGQQSGRALRIGAQYYNGPSLQYSFFDQHEKLLGGGIWCDY